LPGIQEKNLETLSESDAIQLLLKIESRIGQEASTIAKLCGYLPLALRLAASSLRERPDLSPTEYATQLSDAKNRLRLLAGDGNELGVEASINLSYSLLSPLMQKRWIQLSIFQDTFDMPPVSAIWRTEDYTTRSMLSDLFRDSLLEWNDSPNRYRQHDLTRDFAQERLATPDRDEISMCHAAYFVDVLSRSRDLCLKGGDSLMRGLSLFDSEWPNIQAGNAWARANMAENQEATKLCSRYPSVGTTCLNLRQHPRDRIIWREAALEAARRLGDREAEGDHLGNLSIAHRQLGDTSNAIEYGQKYLIIAREISDKRGEAVALSCIGHVYLELHDSNRAIQNYEPALTIFRALGNKRSQGIVLGNLGMAFGDLHDAPRAMTYYEESLKLAKESGDRQGEANALDNVGNAHLGQGEAQRALDRFEQALDLYRAIGDRRGEAIALFNMGLSHFDLGAGRKAIELASAALAIFERLENPNAETVRRKIIEWNGHI
jgi:tetratricopeptide (TPR) repeat protein